MYNIKIIYFYLHYCVIFDVFMLYDILIFLKFNVF